MSVIGPGEKVRFVAARGHGSYDEGGTPVHALGVVLDVTEMRKREDELREALARLKTLSGLLPICMYCKKIRDDEGYWSRSRPTSRGTPMRCSVTGCAPSAP